MSDHKPYKTSPSVTGKTSRSASAGDADPSAPADEPAPRAPDSGTPGAPPAAAASKASIHIEEHMFTVELDEESAPEEHDDTMEINPRDTRRLRELVLIERERQARSSRPLYGIDTESLLVLQNAIRGELTGR